VCALQQRSAAGGLIVAVASVAVITGLIFALREAVPVLSLGVIYMLAVLLVSSAYGLWLGMLTGLLSAAAFNWFHIPPTGRFTIADAQNWVALGVFLVAAFVTSKLAGDARRRTEEAERGRREADLAADMARLLLGGGSVEEALPALGRRIAQVFDLPWVTVELAWVDSDGRRRALPLIAEGGRIGTLLVPADTAPEVAEELRDRVVPAMETLATAARRRDELEAQVIETKALRRSNVVKTALLRSISHDLRTPLTGITTAAGGLESSTLSDAERRELTAVITVESRRLARLVDDLLDLSRIQAGSVQSTPDWVSIEELVTTATEAVVPPPGGFDARFPADLPLIQGDAAQLERALANVLENSARYAGSEPVTVRAHLAGRQLALRVSDHGPGIPKEELERIFEPFYRSPDQTGSGSGLGLAIARGFVEANGGRLRAQSLPGQGTSFVIQLPVPAQAPAPA
jgi:two-component system, OmpR family, sensor histidine kinase KdpD